MITIVVGGFYGDEGKGKIVGYLAIHDKPDIVVRAGSGPQAGHTVTPHIKVTQVPSGLVNPNARLLIARGTFINPDVFLKEVKENGIEGRIFIDGGCPIIEHKHIKEEGELKKRIGSVGSGVGPARVDHVLRKSKLAKDIPILKKYITDVSAEVNSSYEKKKKILIEGVQGYGLSLFDQNYYPFVTSQDTTASQFAADTGIGPRIVDNVVVVYKAYVSRVGQGKPEKEWSEKEKVKRGISEKGTVSGRERRLADFDIKMAGEAFVVNTGTVAAITCVDRLFPGNEGINSYKELTPDARAFIKNIEGKVHSHSRQFKKFQIISTGPNLEDVIDLRYEKI